MYISDARARREEADQAPDLGYVDSDDEDSVVLYYYC